MNNITLSKKMILEIDEWINKFPLEHKQSAIIGALSAVQKHNNGILTKELLEAVAEYLGVAKITVYEIATFYHKFNLQPVGKYKIAVCTHVPCMLCGSQKISNYLKKKLQINFGEITKDFKFSLHELHCVANCDKAPIVKINDQQFDNLDLTLLEDVLERLE